MGNIELLAALLALMANFLWGTDQILGKIALRNLDVLTLNAIRPSFALIFIIPYALLNKGTFNIGPDLLFFGALAGIFAEFIGVQIFFYIMNRSEAHMVIPISNTNMFWSIILAIIFLGEKPSLFVLLSAILIFVGIFFSVSREGTISFSRWKMVILSLFVSFMWGASLLLTKYCLGNGMPQSLLQTLRIGAAAIACDCLAIFNHHRQKYNFKYNFKNNGVKISLISSFFGFGLGFFFFLYALNIETASAIAPFCGGKIFFGYILGILLLKEKPTKKSILGTLMIILGILVITIGG